MLGQAAVSRAAQGNGDTAADQPEGLIYV